MDTVKFWGLFLYIWTTFDTIASQQNVKEKCLPWKSMENLLMAPENPRLVLIFSDQNSTIPTNILMTLEQEFHRIVLLDCNLHNAVIKNKRFWKKMQGKCRDHCTFVVLCEVTNIREIIDTALDFDLVRPWTLWTFSEPSALEFFTEPNFKRTGVLVSIPALIKNSNNNDSKIRRQECKMYNSMKVFSYEKQDFQLLGIFSSTSKENTLNATIAKKLFLSLTDGEHHNEIINLYNETIRVGIKELPPFLQKIDNTKKYTGVCIDILEIFAKALNFSYELVEDKAVGAKVKNGSEIYWTGLFGKLTRRNIHIALGALSVTEDRADAAEFTDHFAEDTSSILSIKPGLRSRVLIFVRVFPWQVWLSLLVAIVIVGPSMTILERGFKETWYTEHKMSIWISWWSLLTSAMQKGEVTPVRGPARILAVFWLMFIVVLVGVYSGLLLAVMSFPGTEEPIDSLGKLVRTQDVYPTAFKPSATYNYIQTGEARITRLVRKKWMSNPKQKFLSNPDEGNTVMSTGRYALLSERMIFHHLIAKRLEECNCCPYHEAKTEFLKHYYSFGVPKNSAIIGSINIMIRRLRQMGIISQWLSDSLPNIASCQETKPVNVIRPMYLEDIQGAFYTLIIGIAASILTLVGEVCINYKRKYFQNQLINP